MSNLTLVVIEIVPFVVGAIILFAGDRSGLYWLVGGSLLVFVGSVVNAWVLLVEIRR